MRRVALIVAAVEVIVHIFLLVYVVKSKEVA